MRHNYVIDFTGPFEGFLQELIGQFGTVAAVDDIDVETRAEVVIIDCAHVGHALDEEALRATLARSRTLGLLNMDDADRATLARVTGRLFSNHIRNVFARTRTGDPTKFTYTLAPDIDCSAAVKADAPEIARRLERQVFTQDSGGSTVNPPDPPLNFLWPPDSLTELCGSRSRLLDKYPFEWDLAHMEDMPGYSAVSFKLTVDSYWYHNNGSDGDNHYYLFLLATFSDALPSARCEVDNVAYPSIADVAYGLKITPMRNNEPITDIATAYGPCPLPSDPREIDGFGAVIITRYGTSIGDIKLSVQGLNSSGLPATAVFSPNYTQIVNEVVFPTISQFQFIAQAVGASGEVRFSTAPNVFVPPPGTGKPMPKTDATPADDSAATPGTFVMLYPFSFAPTASSSSSFDLNFDIEVAVNRLDGINATQPLNQVEQMGGTFDFVALTKLQKVTSIQSIGDILRKIK